MASRTKQLEMTRKSSYKKGITAEDGRRKREEGRNELRKSKKEDTMAKKRQITSTADASQMSGIDSLSTPTEIRQEYIDQVFSADEALQKLGTVQFRKLLSIEKNPPIKEVIETRVVPEFVKFLYQAQDVTLRFEAAWALTNIASGTSEQTQYIVSLNVVPIFISLLAHPQDNLKEQSIWALGNIAGDSTNLRDYVLAQNIMAPLLQVIKESAGKKALLRNCAWTLSNLCRGKPQPKWDIVRQALPALAFLIHNDDMEVLTDSLWCMSYLSDGNDNNIQEVLNSGPQFVSRLLHLLFLDNSGVQTPALRTLGNIVTGNDFQTQTMLDAGALRPLRSLLSHAKKNIRKEAAWTLSNITAGNKEQTDLCVKANIFEPLVNLMKTGEFDVKKECAYVVSNATNWKQYDQILHLINQGIADPLCENLTAKDVKLIQVSLEAIENILSVGQQVAAKDPQHHNLFITRIEEAEGVERLEELQNHENEGIYQKAVDLLEKFFNAEEENGAGNMAPSNSMEGNIYTFGTNLNTNQVFSF